MSSPMYKLSSKDDQLVLVSVEAIEHSGTLRNLIQNLEFTPEKCETMDPITVNNVDEKALKKVVEWMEKHKSEPRVEQGRPADQVVIGEWDERFLAGLDKQEMFDLICAANYLEVQGLMEMACKTVAEWIKGNCPQEMRDNWDRV